MSDLAPQLDAILWNPAATVAAVDSVCAFARERKLRAVCVNSSRIVRVASQLEETSVKTVALVGFPLGTMDADAKRYETELAFDLGAQEVEIVLGLGQIKDRDHDQLLRELRDIVAVAEERLIGITIETARLQREEVKMVCEMVRESGINSVCTSTDFWPDSKVTVDDVKLLRESLGTKCHIKAAGGIRDPQAARALLEAGATCVGSTAAAALLKSAAG